MRRRAILMACGLAALALTAAAPAASGQKGPMPAQVSASGSVVRTEVGSFCVRTEKPATGPGSGFCADKLPMKPSRGRSLAVAPRAALGVSFRERPRLRDTVVAATGTLLRFRGSRLPREVGSVAVRRAGEDWRVRLPKKLRRANALLIQVAFEGGGDASHFVGLRSKRRQPLSCPGRIGVQVRGKLIRGLPLDEARARAMQHGCTLRVVRIDGRDLAVTADLNNSRVNVYLRDGRVKGVDGIY